MTFTIALLPRLIPRLILTASLLLVSLSVQVQAGGTITVYGDSISAGFGLKPGEGWVHLLQERLESSHPDYTAINASVSGETTGGGLIRLPNALEVYQPDILILELGGNDGLRGYPIEKIRQNLEAMLADASASGAKTLLVDMVLPPNYGRRYITAFEGLFAAIAQQHDLPYVPFPLNSSHAENLLQADGIHPTAEAQPMILDSVWQGLLPLLTDD